MRLRRILPVLLVGILIILAADSSHGIYWGDQYDPSMSNAWQQHVDEPTPLHAMYDPSPSSPAPLGWHKFYGPAASVLLPDGHFGEMWAHLLVPDEAYGQVYNPPASGAGSVGATGTQGPVGNTGVAGAVGATGTAGAAGPTGTVGATGTAGAVGATGTPGPSNITATAVAVATATTLAYPSTTHAEFTLTLSAGATITLPDAQFAGQNIAVMVCQNGTGGFTPIPTPTSGLTITGTFPSFTTTANKCGDFDLLCTSTTQCYITGSNAGPL